MFKLARLGAATLLGLLMAITLLVPGAFAQRTDAHHGSATLSTNRVIATAMLTGASQVTHFQQTTQPLSMHWGGWGWGGGWGGWGGSWSGVYYGGWGGWDGCGC